MKLNSRNQYTSQLQADIQQLKDQDLRMEQETNIDITLRAFKKNFIELEKKNDQVNLINDLCLIKLKEIDSSTEYFVVQRVMADVLMERQRNSVKESMG
jgi:hypothetical protein